MASEINRYNILTVDALFY